MMPLRAVIFDRTIYRLPAQTQETYWEDTWAATDWARLVESQTRKDWWDQFSRLPPQLGADELILEAGCGAGPVVFLLTKQGYRVRGVDTASTTIARVKELHPELDLGVEDVEHLALPDASVGLYVSLGVVEHDPEGPDAILAEAARVTRDGGLAFLTIPYHNLYRRLREPWWRLKHLLRRPREVFYQYAYSRRFVEKRLAAHGFEIVELAYCHTNVAIKKDFDGWPMRRYTQSEGRYDRKRVDALAERFNRVSPRLMSHVMAITARRMPRGT